MSNRTALILLAAALTVTCGCAQLPAWQNPFDNEPPAYKSQYGLSPSQKAQRLRNLAATAAEMTPENQAKVGQQLYDTYTATKDPILRRELVQTMGAFPVPAAAAGLQAATEDEQPDVRIAACEAWGRRQGPEALAALASLLKNDADNDVRIAAAKNLANVPSPIAVQELVGVVEDRSPAVQLAVFDALRAKTGEDFGNDPAQWNDYARQMLPADMLEQAADGEMIARPSSPNDTIRR